MYHQIAHINILQAAQAVFMLMSEVKTQTVGEYVVRNAEITVRAAETIFNKL